MFIKKFSLKNLKEEAEAEAKNERQEEQRSIPEMISYVIETYHKPELKMMQEIEQYLYAALFENYTAHDFQMRYIHTKFGELKLSLEEHFAKEEKLVFPVMMDSAQYTKESMIKVFDLENEHSKTEEQLWDIQQNTAYFDIPDDASDSLRQAFTELPKLFESLSEHVDYENNTLFRIYEEKVTGYKAPARI